MSSSSACNSASTPADLANRLSTAIDNQASLSKLKVIVHGIGATIEMIRELHEESTPGHYRCADSHSLVRVYRILVYHELP